MIASNVYLSFLTIALTVGRTLAQSSPLLISVDGISLPLSEAQEEYDKKKNHSGAKDVAISADGKTAEMVGNLWRAFPLPDGGIEVTEDTILEFDFVLGEEADLHMICLDEDKDKDNTKRCFVLARRTFNRRWKYYYSPQLATVENNNVHFKIPIGSFYTGQVKYLAFVQNNPNDTAKGMSTIGNIKVFHEEPSSLNIMQDGRRFPVKNNPVVYHDDDTWQNFMHVSDDGSSILVVGNTWKALELTPAIEINDNTVFEFDFTLINGEEIEAICFEENLDKNDGSRCFYLGGSQSWSTSIPLETINEGETIHHKIPIGKYYSGSFNYLSFVMDNDKKDESTGKVLYSNLELYDADTPGLKLIRNGETTEIQDTPVSYSGTQDTPFNLMHVSEDGTSIEVVGNTYKALELTPPAEIVPNTVFEFDFSRVEGAEVEAICFEDNLIDNDAKRCFSLGGSQNWSNSYLHLEKIDVGETIHYKIPIGNFYTGSFKYLVFVIDMDADKSAGHNIYSNLELYDVELSALKITSYGQEISISDTHGAYGTGDSTEHPLVISEDGSEARMEGNQWKAVTLPSPIEISYATHLDFDFYLEEKTEIHAICFDENLLTDTDDRCFIPANTQGWNSQVSLDPKTNVGETKHYSIPIGSYFTGSVNFVAFVQDNDSDNIDAGASTYSNIIISERPSLNLGLEKGGARQVTPIINHQLSYGSNQDTASNLITVSDDGSSATLRGNTFKAFEIPEGLTIGDNTVLTFDFLLEEITEIHFICIDEDLTYGSKPPRCFPFSGTQDVSNDKSLFYRGIEQIYATNEMKKYVIRLSEFFYGEDFKYLVFGQDNDSSDRTTGVSTFSNIEIYEAESCLKGVTFDFSFDECTTDGFVAKVKDVMENTPGCVGENVWIELLAFFDVVSKSQISEQIGAVCASGYKKQYLPFEVIMGKHFQFSDEFFDGGNSWNYEKESKVDVNRIALMHDKYKNRAIDMPHVHNFKGCELRAAMCCYVADRKSGEADADPSDNSDACYMDFQRAQESSHVRNGYSIYGNGVEGNLNCHGFAWGNDEGYADSALKGNSLFQVAMYDSLYTNGFSEELPSAPMCGCIEQMPVVTKASCTKLEVDQTVSVTYDGSLTEFSVDVDIQNINHVSCTNNDLSSHYQDLVQEGKASEREKEYLDNYLVGEDNCPTAIAKFLEEKGFKFA